MADGKKKYVAAAPDFDRDWLNLWEVEELCRQARAHGLPDEAEVKVIYDQNFLRTRYSIQSGS